jgi:hypothetical protein
VRTAFCDLRLGHCVMREMTILLLNRSFQQFFRGENAEEDAEENELVGY